VFKINWKLLKRILFGKGPPLPDVKTDKGEELPINGLTMGTLIIGRPGSGKTTSLARHIVEYFVRFKDRAIFVLDWSGSISNAILILVQQVTEAVGMTHDERIVYDELGNPEWVIPLPEFSPLYGTTSDEQVQRVSTNLEKLEPELVERTPVVGGMAIKDIAPHLFRILASIDNEQDGSWQITETKKLLTDINQLRLALKDYGRNEPGSKFYLEHEYLNINSNERLLRRYAIHSILSPIEAKPVRARLGFSRPGWTPKEAIENGLMVLIDGSQLINQRGAQHYLFTQAYSLIMAEINKRQPGSQKDKPVALVMDEVYSLLSIKGMAEEIGMLAPLYRSRKLELYIVLQALAQLERELRNQIWNIGNIQSFAVSNFDEAYEIAKQIFKYQPTTVRMPPRTDFGQPIMETDRGQYLKIANQIQRFNHRECILRRYESERVLDRYVRYISKTREIPSIPVEERLAEFKERLLRKRGVKVKQALEVINQRKLTSKPPTV
jgi:hypothetical protein